ncbi:hypothetical protein AVEN_84903-1 [Araneus ventricosus]|uniref:Uncharacterized protein n=1 Tax=Araneus ventricosus TaxID=182803 RepID=A0A4Y2NVU8_ARAVE|nr:hypothetical protein AVEN_84903-1 [Araneus ventricosus]
MAFLSTTCKSPYHYFSFVSSPYKGICRPLSIKYTLRYSALSSSRHVGDIVNQRFIMDPVVKAWYPVKYCRLCRRFDASTPLRFVRPHLQIFSPQTVDAGRRMFY